MTLVSVNYSGYTLDELYTSMQSLNRLLDEERIHVAQYMVRKNRIQAAISNVVNKCKN